MMAFSWYPQQGQPGQSAAQPPQSSSGQPFLTMEDLEAYVRSNSFRSVMKNQNSDLYKFGEWSKFDQFELYQSVYPYTSFGTSNIGTSGKKSARYTRIGDTVIYKFTVKWSSGYAAGSGAYAINMPVQPANPEVFNDVSSWFVDNKNQTFCGDVYVYGGSGIDTEGPIGWIHPSIQVDPATGNALSPGRIMFCFGELNINSQEFYNDQWFFEPGNYAPGTNAFPTSNSVMTGQIIYEASPSA